MIHSIILTTLVILSTCDGQLMEVEYLTNNHGYLPLEQGSVRTIDNYRKILHIVNITNYESTLELISTNIDELSSNMLTTKPIIQSIRNSLFLLKAKIYSIIPHHRQTRGLINVLGKGLKFVTGTMDDDDEILINSTLHSLTNVTNYNSNKINSLVEINNLLAYQISNITNHINYGQSTIEQYINKFKDNIQNRIGNLEDEVSFLEHVYQIDSDISLLHSHIDDIGQVIFTSKLGLVPAKLLTEQELSVIEDFETYDKIKVVTAVFENSIIITLFVPIFSPNILKNILFEPIPNSENKSLSLVDKNILIGKNNRAYKSHIQDNLSKNLEPIYDKCITDIIRNNEANCKLTYFSDIKIKEISQGTLLFSNFNDKIISNCKLNSLNKNLNGTFLITFENCEISIGENTYVNNVFKVEDQIIVRHLMTKIKENQTIADLNLEKLYIKQLNYENSVTKISKQNTMSNIVSNCNTIVIILIIIIIIIYVKPRGQRFHISSEPQSNAGGVTITPANII